MRLLAALTMLALLASAFPTAATHDDHLRDEWATAQGDIARTGVRGHVEGPGTGKVVWRFRPDTIDVQSSAAVAGGVVYMGASDGVMYALDARTGEKIWGTQTGNQIHASAAVSGGRVFVANLDDHMVALDTATGEILWRFDAASRVRSAPTVADGVVYFGAESGRLHALDAATGREVWSFQAGKAIMGATILLDDRLIFGSMDSSVYGIAAENGSLLWKTLVEGGIHSSVASDGSRVIVSSGFGFLYALDPLDGRAMWTQPTGVGLGSPSVGGDWIYWTSLDGLLALNTSSGHERWRFGGIKGGGEYPSITEDFIYVSHGSGSVLTLASDSGTVHWRRDIGTFVVSSPVVVDGLLYVGTSNFYLYALDAGAGVEPLPSAVRTPGVTERETPLSSVVLLAILVSALLIGRRRGRWPGAQRSSMQAVDQSET